MKDVSLDVEVGGFLVLLGPSGSGKSSILHAIAGLGPIDAGGIFIDGKDVTQLLPAERDIAMVFQSFALYPNMTVAQNIGFALEMRRIAKQDRDASVQNAARLFKLSNLLDRKPHHLSASQRQRVSMARAMVREPKIFLFDEPLSSIDAKERVEIRTEIKRLHQSLARTTVYVTHDQMEAMSLATKIAVIKDGVLQQVGTPDEIYHNPCNLFVAGFIGAPAMNLIKGRVQLHGEKLCICVERTGLEPLLLPIPSAARQPLQDHLGTQVIIGLRPESIGEAASTGGPTEDDVIEDCLIELIEPAGADRFAVTRLGGKEVFCRLPGDSRCQSGQILSLAFRLNRAVFFNPDSEARIV